MRLTVSHKLIVYPKNLIFPSNIFGVMFSKTLLFEFLSFSKTLLFCSFIIFKIAHETNIYFMKTTNEWIVGDTIRCFGD